MASEPDASALGPPKTSATAAPAPPLPLPYCARASVNVRAGPEWAPGVAPWTTFLGDMRSILARDRGLDPNTALKQPVLLWKCSADGQPLADGKVDVNPVFLLTWTPWMTSAPNELSLLFKRHEATGAPQAVVVFTFPPTPATTPMAKRARIVSDDAVPLPAAPLLDILRAALPEDWLDRITCQPEMQREGLRRPVPIVYYGSSVNGLDMTLADLPRSEFPEANERVDRLATRLFGRDGGPQDAMVRVAIGVSGCGKTRTLFDIARLGPALYFECVGQRVDQADTRYTNERLRSLGARYTKIEGLVDEDDFKQALHPLLLCRLFVMLQFVSAMKKDGKVAPDDLWKQWLCAQLDGVSNLCTTLVKKIDGTASSDLLFAWNNLASQVVAVCGCYPALLFDEAHRWAGDEYGRYPTSGGQLVPLTDGRSLLHRAMLWVRTVLQWPSVWAGTALSIGDFRTIQSGAALSSDSILGQLERMLDSLILDFGALTTANVTSFLHYFLPEAVTADNDVMTVVADGLRGRARQAASLVSEAVRDKCRNSDDLLKTYKRFCNSLVYGTTGPAPQPENSIDYLSMWRKLLSTLGPDVESAFKSWLRVYLDHTSLSDTVTLQVTGVPKHRFRFDIVNLGLAMYTGVPTRQDNSIQLTLSVDEPLVWEAAIVAATEKGFDCKQSILGHMTAVMSSPDIIGNDIESLLVMQMRTMESPMKFVDSLVKKCAVLEGLDMAAFPPWYHSLVASQWKMDPKVRYDMSASDLPITTALRADYAIKPSFSAGPDFIANGTIFAFKTSPSYLYVNGLRDSQDNTKKSSVEHIIGKAGPHANQLWPCDEAGDQIGCIIVDVQLPRAHPTHRKELKRCVIEETTDNNRCKRRDIRIHVDFALLDMLLDKSSADTVIHTFSLMYFKAMQNSQTETSRERMRALNQLKISTVDDLDHYWKMWIQEELQNRG